jgi:hypothetical protein
MRVRALLATGAAGLVAFGFALALRSDVLALAGTVLCSVAFLTLFLTALRSEARRFNPSVQHDHGFLTWLLGETSTPHHRRGTRESDPPEAADGTTSASQGRGDCP